MKLSVIGGGGVRSMFLAKSIAQKAAELDIDHVVFMDNDPVKLNIYGKMAKHVAGMITPDLNFELTGDAVEAVTDADFIITTIRVGEDHMRVRDERIALAHEVLGQETTGAAGVSFAMRSIPALAEYCELVKKYSHPGVQVFNFTNPAGLVSQALRDMGYDFTYGICDAPSGLLRSIAQVYGVDPSSVAADCYGLNHLSYFSSVKIDGKEMLDDIIANEKVFTDTDERFFTPELLRNRQAILNEYLYYFYYREHAVDNILHCSQTRGEVIEEINRSMTAELSQIDIDSDFDHALEVFEYWYGKRTNAYMANETGSARKADAWKFDVFSPDEGGYAGVALRFVEIAHSGKPQTAILCVPNQGAIPTLEDTDVVEVTCDVTADSCTPHHVALEDIPAGNLELIRRVKYYERTAARGIVNRSRKDLVDAITLHPLVQSYSIAQELVDQYIELNRDYIDGWK